MPIYLTVIEAARATVEKMLTARSMPVSVLVTTTGGTSASMNKTSFGMRLNMPTLAADKWISRGEADRMVGYLLHETAHQIHTRWSDWLTATRDTAYIRDLTNAFEDIRIEREEARGPFKGFGAAMTVLVRHMDNDAQAQAMAAGRKVGALAADLPWVFAVLGRVDCNGLDVPGAARTRAGIAPALRPIVAAGIAGASQTDSCLDCYHLARRIAGMVDDARAAAAQDRAPTPKPTKAPKAKTPKASEPEGEDEPADAPGAGQEPAEDEGEDEPADAPGDSQEPAEGEGEGEGAAGQDEDEDATDADAKGDGAGGPDVFRTTDAASISPDLANILGEQERDGNDLGAQPLVDKSRFTLSLGCGAPRADRVASLRDLMPRSATLSDQVTQLVAAQENRLKERRLTAGRFDRRAMSRAGMGQNNVYAHRHVTPGVDTAVTLLLDLSGSMESKGKLAAAKCMALHLGDAIEDAGAQVAILGFGSHGAVADDRHYGCGLYVFKRFADSMRRAAPMLAGSDCPFSTPLSPGIIAASRWMLDEVDADRYVLGVLTDGACDYGGANVATALRTAVKLGVEPFGLGCLHDITSAFEGFPHVNVDNLKDLPKAGMRQLLAQLEKARA